MPPERKAAPTRRVCFVTGTRAEFGLMRSTLTAIADHPSLTLQLIVTGMHLDRSRGRSLDAIVADGWRVDAVAPWAKGDGSQAASAIATGKAVANIAGAISRLKSDVVLVAGDRVEAFAAASAGHLSGKLVAHVHGGDRALGLIDDSLRHAITKLAHVHFPATQASASRIAGLGEDRWRIFRTGSPGLDELKNQAAPPAEVTAMFDGIERRRFALLLLHPQTSDPRRERRFAERLLDRVRAGKFEGVVIVYPNNDPGSDGIARAWDAIGRDPRIVLRRNLRRPIFLGLMRDAAVLVGNSSSGIIEAASFGTPVVDVGTRQFGRERNENVTHAAMNDRAIDRALRHIWREGKPIRYVGENIYGGGGAGTKIAAILSRIRVQRFSNKLIAY
ncbi:MAG TPA: UDP-N-acetylglucosamine 2-epimerase [Tepidisphaeraceae bacterium]|jgi:UDP-hydrolysing UDP-N-acetyl-D-glucosamine 2-epimerase|nr:UDP-N-acetylglucosamine 2-epimerase [Tepidisphaeraceae bacterium]